MKEKFHEMLTQDGNNRYDKMFALELPNQKQRFKKMDELLKALPIENRETLKLLIRHLNRYTSI